MALPETGSRLIFNADDFGRSRSINEAVLQAHRNGLLTTASLMVNEEGFEEAVEFARLNPRLGVGLHLTLLCGHSALNHETIPGLVNHAREFVNNPVAAGFNYYFKRGLRHQLEIELAAQFSKFRSTGLPLDHVNGHLHMHLHPVVFEILMDHAAEWGISRMRWTRDPFWLNARLVWGRWLYRGLHALVYQLLSAKARRTLKAKDIKHTEWVFGLLQNEEVDQDYLLKLLPVLPRGDVEIYSHPSMNRYKNELDALVSPQVSALVKKLNLPLIRYQDL
jgi:hopanoid biosynthesis associated protein HpnK